MNWSLKPWKIILFNSGLLYLVIICGCFVILCLLLSLSWDLVLMLSFWEKAFSIISSQLRVGTAKSKCACVTINITKHNEIARFLIDTLVSTWTQHGVLVHGYNSIVDFRYSWQSGLIPSWTAGQLSTRKTLVILVWRFGLTTANSLIFRMKAQCERWTKSRRRCGRGAGSVMLNVPHLRESTRTDRTVHVHRTSYWLAVL